MKTRISLLKKYFSASLFLLLFFSVSGIAQIKYAQVGVNGLTCSACTRSVEMSIRKLDFVKDVQMDLKNTEGKIIFKEGKTVSMEKIAQAVYDAGFSVRYLKAAFVFDHLSISEGFTYTFENSFYQFVGVETKKLNGEVILTFLGKKYLDRKGYKKWEDTLKPSSANANKSVYYVTT
ncbi:MAG: heavy metal-associated domain-containing protein [Bacteroidia bacterium]